MFKRAGRGPAAVYEVVEEEEFFVTPERDAGAPAGSISADGEGRQAESTAGHSDRERADGAASAPNMMRRRVVAVVALGMGAVAIIGVGWGLAENSRPFQVAVGDPPTASRPQIQGPDQSQRAQPVRSQIRWRAHPKSSLSRRRRVTPRTTSASRQQRRPPRRRTVRRAASAQPVRRPPTTSARIPRRVPRSPSVRPVVREFGIER